MELLKTLADWLGGVQKNLALKANASAKISSTLHLDSKKQVSNRQVKVTKTNGDVNVNIINLGENPSEKTIDELRQLLIPAFKKNEILFVEEKSEELLDRFNEFKKYGDTDGILDFFKDKIPATDYTILETGIYIAHLISTGENTVALKHEVVERYGERGKNIVNLATAGYFNTHIKPLYEQIDIIDEFGIQDFNEEYERIINQLPFSIFVHNSQTREDVLAEIKERVDNRKKYSITDDVVILHGYSSNANLIEDLLPDLQKAFTKIENNTIYKGSLKITKLTIYTSTETSYFEKLV